MATFFGEVIIPSSRVFFDDNEDSDAEEESPSEIKTLDLKVLDDNSLKNEYDLLLIVEGFVSKGFADVYLLNEGAVTLAEIYLPKVEDRDNIAEIIPKDENSKLYKLNNKTLLLKVAESVDLLLSNQLTLKVMPWLEKCNNIVILNSKSNSQYRCESIDALPPSFVKTLTTSSVINSQSTYERLDQPNFVSGFSASVASWSECVGKPCSLHVNFTDKSVIDSITVAPLLKIIDTSNLSHLIANRSVDTSKFGVSCDQTYMYM